MPREAVAAAAWFDITNVSLWSFMTFSPNIFAETFVMGKYHKAASSDTFSPFSYIGLLLNPIQLVLAGSISYKI